MFKNQHSFRSITQSRHITNINKKIYKKIMSLNLKSHKYTASVRTKIAQHTALARDCAALIWAWRCRGGWKQRQGSRLQRPLTASMQTVTVPSSLAVTESAGCAKRHSDSARLHAPRWYSRHTYSRYPGCYQHKPPLYFFITALPLPTTYSTVMPAHTAHLWY